MPQREEEPYRERALAFLQHVPDRVIDCGNVIGIKRMPQTKHVGNKSKSNKGREFTCIVQIKPPTKQVKQPDNDIQPAQAQCFGPGEGQPRGR